MKIEFTNEESIAKNIARIIEERRAKKSIDITVVTTNKILIKILTKIDMLKGNIIVDEEPYGEDDIMLFSIVGNDLFCQRAIKDNGRFLLDESKVMIVTGEVRADLLSYHKKSNNNVILLCATNSMGKSVNEEMAYNLLQEVVEYGSYDYYK